MCTALIIEDVPHVRKFLFDLLKDYYRPIEVKEASNGVEALDILANEQIDLLVTDIFMPFMDGFSFLEKAQEAQPDIETIIVSAYDDFEYAMKAIEMNVRAFLLKPVSKVELYKAMDLVFQSLDKRRKNREMVQTLEQKLYGPAHGKPLFRSGCAQVQLCANTVLRTGQRGKPSGIVQSSAGCAEYRELSHTKARMVSHGV